MIRNDKAQLYTMEGIASAMLLIVVIIFVLKAAPLTSTTASASHQLIESQLDMQGHDLLTVLDYVPEGSYLNSPLKQAILSWTGERLEGQVPIPSGDTNNTAIAIRDALGSAGIAYDLEMFYNTPGGIDSRAMLWNGKPSDNAVIVSRKIILHDEDMYLSDRTPKNPDLIDIIPDMDSNSTKFYNIVDVRLTLWRM